MPKEKGKYAEVTIEANPGPDERGDPVQRRGVTALPGLYFLGLRRMYTVKSSFLFGVGEDAAYLAEQIAARTPA